MMIIMSVGVHHHLLRHRPYLFLYTFQVDMIIMMTAGGAEDASS